MVVQVGTQMGQCITNTIIDCVKVDAYLTRGLRFEVETPSGVMTTVFVAITLITLTHEFAKETRNNEQ